MTRSIGILLAGLAAGASVLPAQQPAGRFVVVPTFGVMRFDRTTALSSTDKGLSTKVWASGGLSALYALRPGLRAGLYFEAGRAETNPDYFPYVLLRQTGSYQLYSITQKVTFLNYGVAATYDLPVAPRVGPYLKGGVGAHTVFLDVQRANSTKTAGGAQFMLGGGLSYRIGETVALQFELLDFMWNDWDRDDLNTVAASERNTVFEEDNPDAIEWAKPGLTHNLRLALGFKFTPAGR